MEVRVFRLIKKSDHIAAATATITSQAEKQEQRHVPSDVCRKNCRINCRRTMRCSMFCVGTSQAYGCEAPFGAVSNVVLGQAKEDTWLPAPLGASRASVTPPVKRSMPLLRPVQDSRCMARWLTLHPRRAKATSTHEAT